MPIEIKLNTAERIRRAKLVKPGASEQELADALGVTVSQVKAALAYRAHGHKTWRKRA
jgi:uncharacterized protein (DUF433 family)